MRFYYVPKSVFSIYFYKILYNTCIICKKDVLLCKCLNIILNKVFDREGIRND